MHKELLIKACKLQEEDLSLIHQLDTEKRALLNVYANEIFEEIKYRDLNYTRQDEENPFVEYFDQK